MKFPSLRLSSSSADQKSGRPRGRRPPGPQRDRGTCCRRAGRDADRRDEPLRRRSRHAWLGLRRCSPATTSHSTATGRRRIHAHHRAARARGEAIADPYLLRAGDWIEFDHDGKVVRAGEGGLSMQAADLRRAPSRSASPRRRSPEPRAGRGAGRVKRRRALRRRSLHLHRQESLCELSADRRPRDRRRRRGATGPDTAGPAPGTRVVVEPFIGCGHCYPCRIGKPNCCANLTIIGVHREGGFADL